MQTITSSAAVGSASVTDTTAYAKLDIGNCDGKGSPQVARIWCTATASGAPTAAQTGTLRFVLRNSTTVYAFRDATVTVPSVACRAAAAGSSGGYLLTVTFADGRDVLDLLGMETNNESDKIEWYVGNPAAFPTNITAYTVYYKATPVI